ncbi:hypothetical protein ADIAL_0471 [Alkalibacterium sp. AK22]|nr:hypothetical protein ADIAL_0471 [Alkalibacterium sp. AK22]
MDKHSLKQDGLCIKHITYLFVEAGRLEHFILLSLIKAQGPYFR